MKIVENNFHLEKDISLKEKKIDTDFWHECFLAVTRNFCWVPDFFSYVICRALFLTIKEAFIILIKYNL